GHCPTVALAALCDGRRYNTITYKANLYQANARPATIVVGHAHQPPLSHLFSAGECMLQLQKYIRKPPPSFFAMPSCHRLSPLSEAPRTMRSCMPAGVRRVSEKSRCSVHARLRESTPRLPPLSIHPSLSGTILFPSSVRRGSGADRCDISRCACVPPGRLLAPRGVAQLSAFRPLLRTAHAEPRAHISIVSL
ncbi:hypothetical protein HYPSUDRAFT_1027239, partial [Hypholoma sublateritium FD-334 SS-4]